MSFEHLGKALAREEAEKLEKDAKLAEDKRQALLAQQEQRVRFMIFLHESCIINKKAMAIKK